MLATRNHDGFLRRDSDMAPGNIELADQALDVTASMATNTTTSSSSTNRPPCSATRCCSCGNRCLNRLRAMFGYGDWLLAARIDQRLKGAVPYISAFEDAVARNARRLSFAGVVCGHIHYCEVASMGDGVYSNCGEWVESCTAWVEHDDGRIELRHCFTPGRQSDPATVEALATEADPCPRSLSEHAVP